MCKSKIQYALVVLIIIWIDLLRCLPAQSTMNEFETSNENTHIREGNYSTSENPKIFEMNDSESTAKDSSFHKGINLASWRWKEIGGYFTLTLFIVITGLSKVGFHYAHWLSSRVPESCSLIVIGIVVGTILYLTGVTETLTQDSANMPTFTPRLFFLVLLPPVVLEAAYSLYNATFFDNLSTVLLYAVVGTIFNTFFIGALLYAMAESGLLGELEFGNTIKDSSTFGRGMSQLSLSQCLVFSALISAVDPVAVLAIFQEVGVNKDLYFLVFGESLFNDAITVVLYTTMVTFVDLPKIGGDQYSLAVLSFFTVNIGGIVMGVIGGLFTALLSQATGEVRVVEPLAVLGIAYLSYLAAELFHFSGIISITCCGLVQAHYAFKNISQKSYVTVKYFTKMLSATSEAIIFLFLGTVLVGAPHKWNTGFTIWTLVLCLVARFIGVFVLTGLSNIFRVRRIGFQEQFIMAYGGLRGAVGFSLVVMLDDDFKPRQVFVTTTLVVILFTVFIQGATIKPLVKLLDIEVSKKIEHSLIGEINNQVTGHLMAGIEEIIGFKGHNYIKRKIQDFDEKYLQKIFYKSHFENKIKQVYEKWCLSQHYAHLYGPITLVEDNVADILNNQYNVADLKMSEVVPFIPEEKPSIAETGILRRRISEIFPKVEIRKRENQDSTNKEVLRKAFLSNPFNMYHHRYNRNLINDDAQELNTQLQCRRERARQIARLAYGQTQLSTDDESDLNVEERFSNARKKVFSEIEGAPPLEIAGMQNILNRAQRRRTIHLGASGSDISVFLENRNSKREAGLEKTIRVHSFEEPSSSHKFSNQTEMETIRELTPLLSDDERKSHSSNEESKV